MGRRSSRHLGPRTRENDEGLGGREVEQGLHPLRGMSCCSGSRACSARHTTCYSGWPSQSADERAISDACAAGATTGTG
jgi:hypothetical protein